MSWRVLSSTRCSFTAGRGKRKTKQAAGSRPTVSKEQMDARDFKEENTRIPYRGLSIVQICPAGICCVVCFTVGR